MIAIRILCGEGIDDAGHRDAADQRLRAAVYAALDFETYGLRRRGLAFLEQRCEVAGGVPTPVAVEGHARSTTIQCRVRSDLELNVMEDASGIERVAQGTGAAEDGTAVRLRESESLHFWAVDVMARRCTRSEGAS